MRGHGHGSPRIAADQRLGDLADLAYRALLFAFPTRVRREFGADMRALFHEHRRAARHQLFGLTRLWLAVVRDSLVHGTAARLHQAPSTSFSTPHSSFDIARSVRRDDRTRAILQER
ncbi:MAG: hypothetical protein ACRD1S_15350 [Vicinamibacterales bacterium]